MTTQPKQLFDLASPIAEAVRVGLTTTPKWLPAWLFYDQAGSDLFEQITKPPDYYPARTERGILRDWSSENVESTWMPVTLVKPGAGSATSRRLIVEAL